MAQYHNATRKLEEEAAVVSDYGLCECGSFTFAFCVLTQCKFANSNSKGREKRNANRMLEYIHGKPKPLNGAAIKKVEAKDTRRRNKSKVKRRVCFKDVVMKATKKKSATQNGSRRSKKVTAVVPYNDRPRRMENGEWRR